MVFVSSGCLHGIEASSLASDSLRKLRSSIHKVVWSRRQPLASVGAALSLMDGPTGCDLAFFVWSGSGFAFCVGIWLCGLRGSVEAWYTSALGVEEVLTGAADSDVHLFVVDVVSSFDTVDRRILDRVLCSLGLAGWFRHAYFECHAHVRLRFKLASGLGEPWTRDGGIPQEWPLSMMFIVALYVPWCWYLAAQDGVQPQLYADNLKCVSRDANLLLRAARFITGHVRLVGQEPAPSKCVLLSTSRVVRKDMKDWVLS